MRTLIATAVAVALGLATAPAFAQQVKIEAPAPPTQAERTFIAPELQYEITAPDDGDYYPPGPRVRHDPAFFEGGSAPTETGRIGLAGWTSPNSHGHQAGWKEITGWFGLGFAVSWGAPPAPPAKTRVR
ncbi:MAG: hypothetical protein HY216_09870 [Candidatus Rokubacteria bacterium]|nr:hypothetical protein [Candidatus Rokubacteria bacterium]